MRCPVICSTCFSPKASFTYFRSSPPQVFLGKGVLKICIKLTGGHSCRSVIPTKLLCNFSEIALQHGCSPVNLLHIFRTTFPKNTSGGLLLLLEKAPENHQNLSTMQGYKGINTFLCSLP